MTIPKDNSQLENARGLCGEISSHEPQGTAYDVDRSAFLSALGLEVLRFSSRDIDQDFRGACEQIDMNIQRRVQVPLSHLR